MKLRRTMNDKDVLPGDSLCDVDGISHRFIELSGGKVSVISSTSQTALKQPEELGCYLRSAPKGCIRY